ncbi:MAG: hypothetical protein WCZ70_11975 [Sulfurimonadaceae bacterium]
MNNTQLPDPKTLAQNTLSEIEETLKQDALNETNILDALQSHYATLQKNQELYIDYLTEFIDRLKKTQHQDKESLAQLKKQVLKHVLSKEKTN